MSQRQMRCGQEEEDVLCAVAKLRLVRNLVSLVHALWTSRWSSYINLVSREKPRHDATVLRTIDVSSSQEWQTGIAFYLLFETPVPSRSSKYSPKQETRLLIFQVDESSGLYGQLSREESPWRSPTLVNKDMYKQFTAKVYVFSDYVLCLGGKCFPNLDSA